MNNCYVVIASMYDTGNVQTSRMYAENQDEATMLAMNAPEYKHFHTLVVVEEHETTKIAREIECAKQNAERAKQFGYRMKAVWDV